MFLLEKFSSMYLRESLLIDMSSFWSIISDANSSCSSILSVLLRVDEEDLDRILVFFVVFFSLVALFFSCGISGVSALKEGDMGDSGDEEHVDSGASLFLMAW
jgi:hypothetical protein